MLTLTQPFAEVASGSLVTALQMPTAAQAATTTATTR
jgi:hypothetical protein